MIVVLIVIVVLLALFVVGLSKENKRLLAAIQAQTRAYGNLNDRLTTVENTIGSERTAQVLAEYAAEDDTEADTAVWPVREEVTAVKPRAQTRRKPAKRKKVA